MLHNPQIISFESGRGPQLSHPGWRLVHRLVGELESSPVRSSHDQPATRLCVGEVGHRVDAVVGIHMYSAHEPARLVRSDWKNGQIKGAAALTDLRELGMQSCVTGKVQRVIGRTKCPARPQCSIASTERPAGKVLGGNAGESQVCDRAVLPPIPFCYFSGASPPQECTEPKWSEPRDGRVPTGKMRNGCRIEMVIMVVRKYDDIDGRQTIELNTCRHPPFWPRKLDRRCALTEDGIRQDV